MFKPTKKGLHRNPNEIIIRTILLNPTYDTIMHIMRDEELLKEAGNALEKAAKEVKRKKTLTYEYDNPYRKPWKALVRKSQREKKLTSDELQTLEIRKACLVIADCWDNLLHNSDLKGNPIKEAEILTKYGAEMQKLRNVGITKNMHIGGFPESFNNPKKMAEYVAGQLIEVDELGRSIPSEREIVPQIQEISEKQIKFKSETPEQDRIAALISKDYLTPKLKDFAMMRSIVNIARYFLASELDKSELPQRA